MNGGSWAMEKLIFRKPSKKKAQAQTVKVSAKAYNAISAIEAETGLSMTYIATQMVLYAAQNVDIRSDEDE